LVDHLTFFYNLFEGEVTRSINFKNEMKKVQRFIFYIFYFKKREENKNVKTRFYCFYKKKHSKTLLTSMVNI